MGALLGYAAWMLTLTAVYLALPGLSVAFLCLLAASAAGAIVVRVARCRPAHKLPWLLLAAAVFCFGGSRLTLLAGGDRPQIPSGTLTPSLAFRRYALLAVALGLFARARSSGPDRRSLVDAVTVTAGLVLLVWLFRILPTLTDPALSGAQKLASASYPLGQIAILLALARLLAPGIVWDWPVRLVTIGTVCGLVSGVVFGLLRLHAGVLETRRPRLDRLLRAVRCGRDAPGDAGDDQACRAPVRDLARPPGRLDRGIVRRSAAAHPARPQ